MKIPPIVQQLGWRVGRRGATLLFLALVDFVFAWSLFQPPRQASQILTFFQSVAPLPLFGLVWLAVGVICVYEAFSVNDKLGFSCAVVLKVGWSFMYLAAAVVAAVPRAGLSAVIWLALAVFIFIISTWPEVPERIVEKKKPKKAKPDG